MLHCFEFTGFGNYSNCHNWDNGLESVTLNGNPVKFSVLKENTELELPKNPETGVYYTINEYGGSRNVYGVVIATSKREALQMLEEFKNSFGVVEYTEW